ncbi:MAG: ABC transporter permease subunit [Polyangiales bacterium]
MTRAPAALVAAAALAPCAALLGAIVAIGASGAVALAREPHALTGAFEVLAPALVAMALAVPAGVALGAWIARSSGAARAVRATLDALAGVPTGLIGGAAGVLMNAAGTGHDASALALALVALPTVALRAAEAAEGVPRDLAEAALALGASRARAFTHVTVALAWRPVTAGALRAAARVAGESVALVVAAMAARGVGAAEAVLALRANAPTAAALTAAAVAATLAAARLERGEAG